MSLFIAWAMLLAPQEPLSVQDLLKKIDGREPTECFRAIDALADLGSERRAEIEKGAATLPDFYRRALLAELGAPALTPRIKMGNEKRKAIQHLKEVARQAGVQLSTDDGIPGEAFEASVDGMYALEAFAQICTRGKLNVRQDPRFGYYGVGRREFTSASFGHRSAAVILHDAWTTRRIDFSGPQSWRLSLEFETVLGPEVRPVLWDTVQVFEAVGNDDVALAAAGPGTPPLGLESITGGSPVNRWNPKLKVDLLIPDKVDRIKSLRFSARGLISLKERTLEFPGSAGRCEKDGLEMEVGTLLRKGPSTFILNLKVRAKSEELKRVLPSLFTIDMEYEGASGHSTVWAIHGIDGGVACQVEWMFDHRKLSRERMTDEEIEAAAPKGFPDRIRLHLPDKMEERTIFAEFRDIDVK